MEWRNKGEFMRLVSAGVSDRSDRKIADIGAKNNLKSRKVLFYHVIILG